MKEIESTEHLEKCQIKLESFNFSLSNRIDSRDISPVAKIPFFTMIYREALFHRVTELADSSVELFNKPGRAISALLLARAAMETTALVYVLNRKTIEVIETKNIEQYKDYLDTNIFGWRTEGDDDLPKMPNILGAIDHVDKYLDGKFRVAYEGMSEYCHPNCAGVHLAYVKIDKVNRWADIGSEFTNIDTESPAGLLLSSLEIFEEQYNEISANMNKLIDFFEDEIANKT